MIVNGKYTKADVFATICEPAATAQIQALCDHPAFEGAHIAVMPDVHAGAGCTIGTTIASSNRIVVPNLIGVDIGCGIYTLVFKYAGEIDFASLEAFIRTNVPTGKEVRDVAAVDFSENVQFNTLMQTMNASAEMVDYFQRSVGTLGGGNHYIELGKLQGHENIYALFVHTGSRNLGVKVCNYYQRLAIESANASSTKKQKQELIARYKAAGREKEIQQALASFSSLPPKVAPELMYLEGENFDSYVNAMKVCNRFAFLNRTTIALSIMSFFKNWERIEAFDTVHNYLEEIDQEYFIRKGAISAKQGEKVAISLNMRDGVILGTGLGNKDWNCSAPHGAGRLMSRKAARENLSVETFEQDMAGINTWSVCEGTLDESPRAYKPANEDYFDLVRQTVEIQYIVKPLFNLKDKVI